MGPPSIPATVFIALLGFVPVGLQQPLLNSDGDLARHLRHGRFMLEHESLIRADPFSFTRPGAPFVGFEYGSQVFYAVAERVGGLPGVAILAGVLIGATYALLAAFLIRRGVDPLLAYLATILAALVGAGHWVARPHLFSFLAVILLMGLLERPPRRSLLPFVLLFAVWANIHGGFIYGWVLISLYLAGSLAEARWGIGGGEGSARVRYYAAGLVGAVIGTIANPRGLVLHQHLFAFLGKSYLFDNTAEFTSPDFHEKGAKLFLGVVLLCIAALSLEPRRLTIPRLLVVCAGIGFALIAVRNMSLFGLTALPLLALHLDASWRRLWGPSGLRARFERTALRATTLPWVLPAALLFGALAVNHGRAGSATLIADQFDPTVFPLAAVTQARADRLEGRLFTEFVWGGYVLYAWPEQKVFIDGGTDFYGEKLFREYGKVKRMAPGWRDVLKRWNITLLLLRRESSLAHQMVRDGGWDFTYCDSLAVLLRRTRAQVGPSSADSAEGRLDGCAKRSSHPFADSDQ